MSQETSDWKPKKAGAGRLGVVALLVVSLLAAGAARYAAGRARTALEPELNGATAGTGDVTLGQLNSFTLALLLGGLRGPLVMALWSSSEQQKMDRELEDFDTKIELIRLLQPQFDSVHLYQIWNKAYNQSVEMANVASRYAVVLDAVDYAQKVLEERPNNIDLETQLGEVYANKLGAAQEKDYFIRRVLEETQAEEPIVRIEFPTSREAEVRRATLVAGVSPRSLQVRRSDEANRQVTALPEGVAETVREILGEEGITYEELGNRHVNARGVGGPLRLEPMLGPEGVFLPHLVDEQRRQKMEESRGLDGGVLGFLEEFAPFPEGVSPHALAYNRFMKALVLQEVAGQRHVQRSQQFVHANPGRALRDWALSAYEQGRLLEAEAFDITPVPPGTSGELQAQLEQEVAGVSPAADPVSEALLTQAVQQYERSLRVGEEAMERLNNHVQQYPESAATFGSTIDRLSDLQLLLTADVLYDRLILDEVEDREAARREATSLYREASTRFLTYLLQYHTPEEVLPPGVTPQQVLSMPLDMKLEVLELLRQARDQNPDLFPHTRVINEFDGYFARINARLSQLQQAQTPA